MIDYRDSIKAACVEHNTAISKNETDAINSVLNEYVWYLFDFYLDRGHDLTMVEVSEIERISENLWSLVKKIRNFINLEQKFYSICRSIPSGALSNKIGYTEDVYILDITTRENYEVANTYLKTTCRYSGSYNGPIPDSYIGERLIITYTKNYRNHGTGYRNYGNIDQYFQAARANLEKYMIIYMTREKASEIVKDFLKNMNPDMWDGNGNKPKSFEPESLYDRNRLYPLTDRVNLIITFVNNEEEGWHHRCDLVYGNAWYNSFDTLSGCGIDSMQNIVYTVLSLCRRHE